MTKLAPLGALAAVAVSTTPSSATAQLSGDEEASALVQRMLETLGGRDTWAQARTIYIELRGYYAPEPEPWVERYWIDLEVPRGRYEIRSGESERVIAWTTAGGWESRDGVVEPQSEERHALEQAYWARELTVVIRRLAAGVPASRLELDSISNGLRTITVIDARSGEPLSQLTLTPTAEPVRWSATINEDTHERVLGPLEEYDGVRIPRWGATPSGIWRYEHLAASLSSEPPPVSFEPPAEVPHQEHSP
jgi:hypothetical protein